MPTCAVACCAESRLYTSHISEWRKARERGALSGQNAVATEKTDYFAPQLVIVAQGEVAV